MRAHGMDAKSFRQLKAAKASLPSSNKLKHAEGTTEEERQRQRPLRRGTPGCASATPPCLLVLHSGLQILLGMLALSQRVTLITQMEVRC